MTYLFWFVLFSADSRSSNAFLILLSCNISLNTVTDLLRSINAFLILFSCNISLNSVTDLLKLYQVLQQSIHFSVSRFFLQDRILLLRSCEINFIGHIFFVLNLFFLF
uniref:Uncharacterized protein n=1 Tax=Cacopsylla melanoneura TaxID=428564 RepID=A0A8D9BZ09_9HEMI